MELKLSDVDLQALAEQIAPLISPTKPEPDWVKLEDIRADLFAGKAKSWIRLYIFDQFPEVQIENGNPKAWVVGAHGTGKITKIYLPYARDWMHKHHDEIDWTAKEVR
ncbi:hypothetical protein PO250_06940 [Limosilactobacillus mucosae]|uniref:DUF771 domain-containing protein n=1 Tax=Limosilactobacillus mucosae TaxID=97478 RepID=A0AAJ1HUN7_LIMMU|nr:hypothetical protein [Limosilactobacillus mucosae]MDC2830030.1 hypothetical protein [Limosilactobacillus mucosae]MDC2837487.1 hypothetical protein [Limosilactobacillus mucosae]MDC2853754.1 hypothetical protein [Limosilactobacillus mucosae]